MNTPIKSFFAAAALITVGMIFAYTTVSAGQNAKPGADRDSAIILFPLPFEQNSEEVTLKTNDDAVWFLFYAQKDQVYSFLLSDPDGRNIMKAELFGSAKEPEQATKINFSSEKKVVVRYQVKESGNYFLRVVLEKNGPYKGKLVYQTGAFKPQS